MLSHKTLTFILTPKSKNNIPYLNRDLLKDTLKLVSFSQVGGISSLLQASQWKSGVSASAEKRQRFREARLYLVTGPPQQQHRGIRRLLLLHEPVKSGLLRGCQLPLQYTGLPYLNHASSSQKSRSVW